MKRWIAAFSAMMLSAGALQSQEVPRWFDQERSFSLSEENDALGGNSDSAYTQGIRFSWNFAMWRPKWNKSVRLLSLISAINQIPGVDLRSPDRACVGRMPRKARPCGAAGFALGQTEYTPPNLLESQLQTHTRPYAGHLFGAFSRTLLYEKFEVNTEVQLGVTGPASIARETQSLAHWTWSSGSPQPQGWHNQLKTMVHATLVNNYAFRAIELCGATTGCDGSYGEDRWFDITPRTEIIVGSLMDRVSPGITIRLGHRFPEVMGVSRIPVARAAGTNDAGQLPWFMLFATADERFSAYNALLTGSVADRGPNGWRTLREIEATHIFDEIAGGFAVGYRKFTFTYQRVHRGAEYKPGGGTHTFGSFNITFHADQRASQ